MLARLRSITARVRLPLLLLAAGNLAVMLFGVIGVMRGDLARHTDLQTLYVSGVKLLDGIDPYGAPYNLAKTAAEGVGVWIYAYPPNFAPFAMALGAMGFKTASLVTLLTNLCAALALCGAVVVLARERSAVPGQSERAGISAAAVVGAILVCPFVSHVLWLGNTTLMVAAALLWSWWLLGRGRTVLAGVLIACAAVKPQLVLLPGIWLLLERRWTTIAAAAVTSLVLSSWQMWVLGPIGAFSTWIEGMRTYASSPENVAGDLYCFGFGDLLAAGNVPPYFGEALVVVGMVLVWWYREHLSRLETVCLLTALTALFLPAHNYDLVILAPLVGLGALWCGSSHRRIAAGLVVLGLFYLPLRLVALAGSDLVLRWREVMLFAIVGLMLWIAHQRRASPAPLDGAAVASGR